MDALLLLFRLSVPKSATRQTHKVFSVFSTSIRQPLSSKSLLIFILLQIKKVAKNCHPVKTIFPPEYVLTSLLLTLNHCVVIHCKNSNIFNPIFSFTPFSFLKTTLTSTAQILYLISNIYTSNTIFNLVNMDEFGDLVVR